MLGIIRQGGVEELRNVLKEHFDRVRIELEGKFFVLFGNLVHSKSSSWNGSRCHFRYLLSWHSIPTRREETLSKNSIDFTTIRITFFIIERNILSL